MSETLKMVLIFLSGCVVGSLLSIGVMALCIVAKQADMPKPEEYEVIDNTWGAKKNDKY